MKLLCRASEVTMKQFKQCICHSNFSVLVVQGTAGPVELAEAWATLFYEYCDLIEATEVLYRTRLMAEIACYKRRNDLVMNWTKLLAVQYFPNVAAAIKILGFEFELNPEDPEQYQADLSRIQSEINYSKLLVRIKEVEYASIIENISTQDSVEEKYFRTIFFRINNYAKREAVNDMTSVEDYCAALKDYVDYCTALNNLANA